MISPYSAGYEKACEFSVAAFVVALVAFFSCPIYLETASLFSSFVGGVVSVVAWVGLYNFWVWKNRGDDNE